jgi:hypothetical protein
MERTPIKSSHIKSMAHDAATNSLEVEFQNGKVYTYPNVNKSAYLQILAAPSAGEAFHRIIRPFDKK